MYEHNLLKNLSTTIADIMRNLTVRFERTKLIEFADVPGDDGVYDVSDTGALIRGTGGNMGFYQHGNEEPGVSERSLYAGYDENETGPKGECVSLIGNVAAFSCGSVVSWEWNMAWPEGAEVVGNVVRNP